MLDSMVYKNHINEIVEFGVGGILINTNDFRDYEWIYNSRYKKITSFTKDIAKKTLPILIEGTGNEARAKADRMFEVFDKDVLTGQEGTIIINGFELKGFFYASKKIDYTQGEIIKLELQFVTDKPLWKKESEPIHFNIQDTQTKGLDYNHDFAYDFTSTLYTAQLINENYTETAFKLILYGKAINPTVQIGGNTYAINGIVEKDERIEIDSINKTVELIKKDGSKVNMFGDRDKDFNIFAPIESGQNSVSWGSDFSFDVILIEQRSEPRWN